MFNVFVWLCVCVSVCLCHRSSRTDNPIWILYFLFERLKVGNVLSSTIDDHRFEMVAATKWRVVYFDLITSIRSQIKGNQNTNPRRPPPQNAVLPKCRRLLIFLYTVGSWWLNSLSNSVTYDVTIRWSLLWHLSDVVTACVSHARVDAFTRSSARATRPESNKRYRYRTGWDENVYHAFVDRVGGLFTLRVGKVAWL